MPPRQTLFTDERMGDALWSAIAKLPEGSGVLFRHKSLPTEERAAMGHKVAERCRARGLILSVSEDVGLAKTLGAAMVHKPKGGPSDLPFSLPVHSESEARAAKETCANLVYVSPVYPTRSHPGAPALGVKFASRLAQLSGCPAIALGGMNALRFGTLDQQIFSGWAGIDAWL